jgi:staphyloferrin B biosynthesis citrate synthase
MDGKQFREALRAGRRLYGTLISSTSPKWMDIIPGLHLDCVFIDTEHIPLDWHELGWMCHAFRGLGIVPIVRLPKADPFEACRVLDMGARGIVAAYVETAEEVRLLRGAVKLRPLKGRRLEDILSGRDTLTGEMADYVRKYNENHVLLVNIESAPAIQALDEILAVPDLDGVLIGPHDLSCSLDVPEQYDHPEFEKAVRGIITKARAKNLGAGAHFLPSVDHELKWAQAGLNLVLHLADLTLFRRALHEDLTRLRENLGEKISEAKSGDVAI